MNSKELIKNYTHNIKDENLNEWKVIEVSDLDEIIQVSLEEKLTKLDKLQNAAPDLLEALQKCEKLISVGYPDSPLHEKIKKAINKAL